MRILIAKLSALGDVLRTTALLRPLKERYPSAELWWLTSKAAAPLLEGNPWVDQVATLEESSRVLWPEFDLGLSLEETPEAARWVARHCSGEIIGVTEGEGLGYSASSEPYYGMSLLRAEKDGGRGRADQLKAENQRGFVDIWLGILGLKPGPGLAEPVLTLSAHERQEAWLALERAGAHEESLFIGFNPGAGARWPAKQLSEARSAAVIDELAASLKNRVVLLGGPDEAGRNADILRRSRSRVLDGGTRHPLRVFAAMIESCRIVLTADSLAFHMACALRRPVVVFVGPTSAAELDLFARGAVLTPALACSCFYKPRCLREKSCLEDIPVEEFSKIARALLRL